VSNGSNSIREAAVKLGMGEMRVRTLLREGRLAGEKSKVEGTEVEVWRISDQAIADYSAQKQSGGNRQSANGRVFKIRVSNEQLADVQAFMAAQGIELGSANNYDPEKARAYRQRRNAATKGEASEGTEGSAPAQQDLDLDI
jgi:hypothetical protein